MAEDPYAPPKAKLADAGSDRPGSMVKAILLGIVTDIGGTYSVSFLFLILLSFTLGAGGGESGEVSRLMAESDVLRAMLFAIGMGFSVLGGYVAARVANRTELNASLLCGVCVVITGALLDAWFGNGGQTAGQLALTLATIPAALFGGWLRKRNKRRAAT
jgi:MFS family permease